MKKITKEQILEAVDHLTPSYDGDVSVYDLATALDCSKQTTIKHLATMEDELKIWHGRRDTPKSVRRLTAEEKASHQRYLQLRTVANVLEESYKAFNPFIRVNTDNDGIVTGDLEVNLDLPIMNPEKTSKMLQALLDTVNKLQK